MMAPPPAFAESVKPSLLWIEDSEDDILIFSRTLRKEGLDLEIRHVEDASGFETALSEGQWDVILADYNIPFIGPDRVLGILKERSLDVPIIVVSGLIEAEETIRLMKSGVRDIVLKHDVSRLAPAIDRELVEAKIRRERLEARAMVERRNQELTEALDKLKGAQDDIARLQRSRALGEIARGVTHHFNNLLMRGIGLLDTLDGSLEELPKNGLRDSSMASLEGLFMEGSELMKRFAEFHSEEVRERPVPVNLERLVSSVSEEFADEFVRRGIDYQCEVHTVRDVIAEEGRLSRAMRDLFANSIEAMPGGGMISVSIRPNAGGRALMEISDTGCGMNRDVLRHCFEPFFSTKGEFGTGIGLSLAESIVHQQGGFLTIESTVGVGTKVSLILRKAACESEETSSIPVSVGGNAALKGKEDIRILVVEDEPIIGDLVCRFLRRGGYQTELADSGAEALDLFRDSIFDLIISDRSMPGMGGDELARIVEEESSETPFVMLTGFGELMKNVGEWPYGVDRILSKPVDSTTLLNEVSDVFGTVAVA